MSNNTATLPAGPTATFTSPLLTISYTPAGLGYIFHPIFLRLLVWLHSLFTHPYIMLVGIVFSTLLYYLLHRRLISLETAPSFPVTLEHVLRMLDIQRTTIAAIIATQDGIGERFDALSFELRNMIEGLDEAISSNLNPIVEDIAALSSRSKLQREQMRILHNNLDIARELLGAGAELSVDDGLEMGDEMETFWPPDILEGEEEEVNGEEEEVNGEEEEEIDMEKSNEMVWAWFERCAWPEECLDA